MEKLQPDYDPAERRMCLIPSASVPETMTDTGQMCREWWINVWMDG